MNPATHIIFRKKKWDSGGGSTPPTSVTFEVTSAASSVDGLFHVIITPSEAVTGLTTSGIAVTNGTADYLIPNSDNTSFRLFVIPDGVGDVAIKVSADSVDGGNLESDPITVTINTSWKYLVNSSTCRAFYDFRDLIGYNTDVITTAQQALHDLSGNGRNLSIISSPQIRSQASQPGINGLRSVTTTGALSLGETGSTIFNSDHSISFKIRTEDGIQASAYHVAGNIDATNNGESILFTTAGKLQVRIQGAIWESTAAALADGIEEAYFDLHFDFTNDVFSVNKNGSSVAGSFTTSSMAAVNPASYACTANFYIGARNVNGTLTQAITTSVSLRYFAITNLQSSPTPAAISTYLNDKKPAFELMDILTSTTDLKAAHHIAINPAGTIAAVVGKGHTTATDQDGSVALVDLSDPTNLTILDSEPSGTGDLIDARTSVWISATRLVVFVSGKAILYDVSTPTAMSRLSTVTYTGNVNGAVLMGGYIIGAGMTSGNIYVFTFAADTLALLDSYSTLTNDAIESPLDVFDIDNENIVIANHGNGTDGDQIAIYKIFDSGSLIPCASWTLRSSINSTSSPDLRTANRVMVNKEGTIATLHTNDEGHSVVSIDLSDLDNPAVIYEFSLGSNDSSGKDRYRNKYVLAASGEGYIALDFTVNPIIGKGGIFDRTNFSNSTRNSHEPEWFINNNQNYLIGTYQADSKIATYKMNRF